MYRIVNFRFEISLNAFKNKFNIILVLFYAFLIEVTCLSIKMSLITQLTYLKATFLKQEMSVIHIS